MRSIRNAPSPCHSNVTQGLDRPRRLARRPTPPITQSPDQDVAHGDLSSPSGPEVARVQPL
jgi:hypothetical protein